MTSRQPSILTPQKIGPIGCELRAFRITLVMEWGRILGLLPGMGPSIRITRLSVLPLLWDVRTRRLAYDVECSMAFTKYSYWSHSAVTLVHSQCVISGYLSPHTYTRQTNK